MLLLTEVLRQKKVLSHRSHLDRCETVIHPLAFPRHSHVRWVCGDASDGRIGSCRCPSFALCTLSVRLLSWVCEDPSRRLFWTVFCLIVYYTFVWVRTCSHLTSEFEFGFFGHSSSCTCEMLQKCSKNISLYFWLTVLNSVFRSLLLHWVCSAIVNLRASALCGTRQWKHSVGVHLMDWRYVILCAMTAMLTCLSHCSVSAVTLILRICFSFWWVRSTQPIVCACFGVAILSLRPDAGISSDLSCNL